MTSSRKTKAALQAAPDLHAQLGLRPGQSIELLKELHILTRDGRLNQDSRRKLKQVNHLLQFIEKVRQELPPREGGLLLADHGAGKSYLGFMLYDLWRTRHEPGRELGHLYGIETRADLVERSRELAARLGFERMSFINTSAAESAASAALPDVFDVVTALHACDTATDDAIAFALRKQARAIVLAPLLPGRGGRAAAHEQGAATGAHAAGRAVAPPLAYARDGQPAHQRAALPLP